MTTHKPPQSGVFPRHLRLRHKLAQDARMLAALAAAEKEPTK